MTSTFGYEKFKGRGYLAGVGGLDVFTRYRVPPEMEADAVEDLTAQYHTMIVRGYAPAGRLNPQRFWRLPMLGDTNIFIGAHNPIKRVHASVALLWDFSSSQSAYQRALVHSLQIIGGSLQRNGVEVWAAAYTTERNGVGIFEVNGWRDKWDHRRAQTLVNVHMGDTPTGASMHYVRRFILPRAPTSRRMLVVCTDGAPGDRELMDREITLCRMFGPVCSLYVGDYGGTSHPTVSQFGERYAFFAPKREDIPDVFTQILGRLRG